MVRLGLLSIVFFSCDESEEVLYAQFNAEDEQLTVEVGVLDTLDPREIVLHSTTGAVEIGSAQVSPGGGPLGTEHTLIVEVGDDWEDQVVKASVRTESGERGEDEYTLEPDSADEGVYQITLISVGEEGEVRDDIFTIRLWEEEASSTDEGDTAE